MRIELAASFIAAGDRAGGEAELNAAERLAQRISSPRLLAQCDELRAAAAEIRALAVAGQR
jgi:hypothetical protein